MHRVLVVDDDMHSAAGGVTTGLRQCQSLLVHALATKGSVAVHKHWQPQTCRSAATVKPVPATGINLGFFNVCHQEKPHERYSTAAPG